MKLLFSQCVLVDWNFSFLFFWLLSRGFILIIRRLSLSALPRLSVRIEVFSDNLRKLISVDARTQDLAHLHKDLTVLVFIAHFRTSLQNELLGDEVMDLLANARIVS